MARVKPDHSLHVLVPSIRGQRWSCHSCSNCCRTLVGHLFEHERERIERQNWAAELGAEPYVRAGRNTVLNKRTDGACVFLDGQNRCLIHSRYGEQSKPLACRVFPFSLRPVSGGWQASLRFDCPSVIGSVGPPVRNYGPFLREIAAELGGSIASTFIPGVSTTCAEFARGLVATEEEIESLNERLVRWFLREQPAMTRRLIIAARWTTVLDSARLQKVRGQRFAELLDLLVAGLAAEPDTPPPQPTRKQQGMLRQFAFACCEHVSLEDLQGGFLHKLRLRQRQLRAARMLLRGNGALPTIAGIPDGISFDAVEQVRPAGDDDDRITDLLERYLISRIQGRTLFADGYYGWPVFRGLAALCVAMAAVGWLARAVAAGHGRVLLEFDDVSQAIGMVDRAATRLPALGSMAERGRVAYLLADDGLSRLLSHYSLVCK